jgi:general secretion pathway protein N
MKRGTLRALMALFAAGFVLAGLPHWPCCASPGAGHAAASTTFAALEGRQAPGLGDAEPAAAPPPAAPREPRRPSGNPLWAVPLRSLSATRDRPLFTPSRRPPAPAVAAAPVVEAPAAPRPAVPERPSLTLVGTIIGEGDKIAIFFNPASHAVVRLRLGEADNGWVLRSVGAREIVLEKGGQSFTLALPAPEDAPAQPPPPSDEQL